MTKGKSQQKEEGLGVRVRVLNQKIKIDLLTQRISRTIIARALRLPNYRTRRLSPPQTPDATWALKLIIVLNPKPADSRCNDSLTDYSH